MNKIHSPAFGGVGALRAPTVDFVHFFVDFPCAVCGFPAYLPVYTCAYVCVYKGRTYFPSAV